MGFGDLQLGDGMTTPYREAPKYEYDVANIYYRPKYANVVSGVDAVRTHMAEMSNSGWRLVAVTDAAEAWTFFWERLR